MKTILITGSNGAIGQGLCQNFSDKGWRVIGTDLNENSRGNTNFYFSIDLDRLCTDEVYCDQSIKNIISELNDGLDVLVNNAATQILAPVKELTFKSWQKTININLSSVFILVKGLLPELEGNKGNVVNISSVHAILTKPNFSAYATSKAGLIGLTKSLAVELGSCIRVNAICPAAIDTPMLHDGFNDNPNGLSELKSYHPTACIGSVKDMVNSVVFLSDNNNNFLNGSILDLSGGISSSLHDPILEQKS
jgi:NAD(P)-dependent dehydrogenase (short-subunit alcohol dehydrogenase family)